MLIGVRGLQDTYHGWSTPYAAIYGAELRLGESFGLLNDSTQASFGVSGDGNFLKSGSVVATTAWPSADTLLAIAAGKAVYVTIHANQVSGSGKPSAFQWADIVKNTSPYLDVNGAAISAQQASAAIATRMLAQHVLTPFRLFLGFHHEPEDDAKVNGFGKGNMVIDSNGNYAGASGATIVSGQGAVNFPGNVTTVGDHSGYPSSGTLTVPIISSPTTYCVLTYDNWTGNTLHVTSATAAGSPVGAFNFDVLTTRVLLQAWTQDLTSTAGDVGQAAAAGALWANAYNAFMGYVAAVGL